MKEPFFPLKMLAFPGEVLHLHIFEPRYVQLFEELDSAELAHFILVPMVNSRVHSRGTKVKFISIDKRYSSGAFDVSILAEKIVKVIDYEPVLAGKLYAGGTVEIVEQEKDEVSDLVKENILEESRTMFFNLGVQRKLPKLNNPYFFYALARGIGINYDSGIKLLGLDTDKEKSAFILEYLAEANSHVDKVAALKRKIQQNGHYQYIADRLGK